MTTKLYRAMCAEEAESSLAAQKPDFIRRFKWFSPDRDFVTGRAQDGNFNNSRFKTQRYTELLSFTFPDESEKYFTIQNDREWKLDRRKAYMAKCMRVEREGLLEERK